MKDGGHIAAVAQVGEAGEGRAEDRLQGLTVLRREREIVPQILFDLLSRIREHEL